MLFAGPFLVFEKIVPTDPLVQWFWQAVEGLSVLELRDLWVFCSGSKGLPPGGFGRLTDIRGEVTHFCLLGVEAPAVRLPVAHTCTYHLEIPLSYGSVEEVGIKLRAAISCGCAGFGFPHWTKSRNPSR